MGMMRSGLLKLLDADAADTTGSTFEVFSPDGSGLILIVGAGGTLNEKVDVQGSFDGTIWVTLYRADTDDLQGDDTRQIAKVIAVLPLMRAVSLSGGPVSTTVWLKP